MVKRKSSSSVAGKNPEKLICVHAPPDKTSSKRLKTKSLYKQPTVSELNRLRETENLFNSNLFRLQVEEILREVCLDEKTQKRFEKWFQEFQFDLDSIHENNVEYDLTEKFIESDLKVKLPICSDTKKTKCSFKFYKFKSVDIIGSYKIGSAINSNLIVDIQIAVPANTYVKNDSINYRYHKKRAAYLAYLASHLKKQNSIGDLTFSWFNGCQTKAMLDIKPSGKLAENLKVRIHLSCDEEAFKLQRFAPARNNLRENWLFTSNKSDDNQMGPPTPYYNCSVLSDLTMSINHKFLLETFEKCENLKHAIILLKIWIRQRKLNVSGYVISLFVAYLVQDKRINNIMSSYQIVRNVWISLKTSEWDVKGITLCKNDTSPQLQDFLDHFPVVFVEKTGYFNLCYQMSKGIYENLRRESCMAIEMLDKPNINSFIPLFMTPFSWFTQFDHVIKFKNWGKVKQSVLNIVSNELKLNYGLDDTALVIETLHSLLTKGLGNRSCLILPVVESQFTWPVKKSPDKFKTEKSIEQVSLGIVLNPENAFNPVEKGAPANLPEAEEFRLLWGDKSELRRFQDGSILETCVWNGECAVDRRTITKQIVDHLFKIKYGIDSSELYHICDQLDGLLVSKRYRGSEADTEEGSLRALQVFDMLRRDLRSLTNLPLDIAAVYGVSSVFSYTEPVPAAPRSAGGARGPHHRGASRLLRHAVDPRGATLPEYTPVYRAVMELGYSGKWPGDIEAFRCLKAAFHLQIAEELTKQYSLPTQAHPTHLDVIKNGLAFRLEVVHPKELALLQRKVEGGVVKHEETEESVKLHLDKVLLPKLRGALHGLHQKHPAYGPTACMFKRWLSCHLLSRHFPDIVADLLTAAIFVQSEPLAPPCSPLIGLLRVLRLLADTDWSAHMLLLDFNGDMKPEDITAAEKSFAERDPASPALYIASVYGGPASGRVPARPVLTRAKSLATASLRHFENVARDMREDMMLAFIPSLEGYDLLIHLHESLVPYAQERLDRKPEFRKFPESWAEEDLPVLDFHPVEKYLQELKAGYDDLALFFHDAYGGNIIAVLWTPKVHEISDTLQVANSKALKPVNIDGEIKYKVNTEAIVEDFKIIGNGLVKEITLNT